MISEETTGGTITGDRVDLTTMMMKRVIAMEVVAILIIIIIIIIEVVMEVDITTEVEVVTSRCPLEGGEEGTTSSPKGVLLLHHHRWESFITHPME